MIPLTRALVLILLTAGAMGYGWHRACVENRRLTKDRDTFAEDADRAMERVRRMRSWMDSANRRSLNSLRLLKAEKEYSKRRDQQLKQVAGDLEWARLTIAIQAAPTHRDRMTLLGNKSADVIEFPTRGA